MFAAVSGAGRPVAAAPAPIDAYGRLPGIEQITLSPAGDRYAFIAVIGDSRKLVAATIDNQTALFEVPVGGAKVVSVDWAGEDHLLVTITHTVPLGMDFDVDKGEFYTVVAIDLKKRKAIMVFDGHAGVAKVVVGAYGSAQVGGRWYG